MPSREETSIRAGSLDCANAASLLAIWISFGSEVSKAVILNASREQKKQLHPLHSHLPTSQMVEDIVSRVS